ncbi:hypothetical protein TWF696_001862 [Orbilia brochopaga]|uniref:Uncharacterized protein n=1 Tax=Orbilia brochopaga TaxID=3140254 RepID=A0AAV9U6A0_9PEZI
MGMADPKEVEEVIKIGALSDLTFGTINGVKDAVNFKDNGIETREWCIAAKFRHVFSEEGDSESFVLNREGKVVGMITSGCDHITSFSYMTPIKLILEDIRKQTGKEMTLVF